MAAVVVLPCRDVHALSNRTDSIARCGLCSYANSLRSRIHQNTRRLFSRYSRLMFQLRRGTCDSALPRHLDSGQHFAAIRRSYECQLRPRREFRVVIPCRVRDRPSASKCQIEPETQKNRGASFAKPTRVYRGRESAPARSDDL
jgi:hypothetical protein